MAKNKAKAQPEEELIGQEEVVYEEVKSDKGSSSGESQSFFQKYRNFVIIGGIGVVVLGVFLLLRMSGREAANQQAQTEMVPAVLQYEQDSFLLALNGGGQVVGLEAIADEYGNTAAGQLAKFYAGTSYLHLGNLDQGVEYLEDYKKGSTMVSAAAYAALGYAHEQKGEFAEAAEAYADASRTPVENAYSTPFYLMNAARNHESAGDNDAALGIYREIKEKYPLSPEGGNIDKYIAKLSSEDDE